jgi:two-component system, NtrC family, sensor kinase
MKLAEFLPIFLIWFSIILALLVVFRAWRYRARPAVKAFLWLMAALAWWLFSSTIEYSGTSLAQHVLWIKTSYLGITTLPVFWLVFILHYADQGKWWRRRGLPLLFILPVITMVIVWTNDLHHLMWQSIRLDNSVYPALEIMEHNSWFWAHALYSYLLLLIGTVNLFQMYFRGSGIYRKQVGIMLLASFIPWVANFVFIAEIGPDFAVDPTPMAFVVTSIAFLWGLSRMKLLNMMPVAYETIFKSIGDGVIVIDERNHIREVNPAAAGILRAPKSELLGKKLCRVIPAHAYSQERIPDSRLTETVLYLVQGQMQRFYKMQVSPISDGQRRSGRLVLLHDDTERRNAENESKEKALLKTELKARLEMQEALADTSQRLQALSEDSPVMICNIDLEGGFKYVNKKFEEVTGYRRQEILGTSGFELGLFDKGTALLLKERMKMKLLGEPARPLEIRCLRRDKKWIWLSMVAEPIRDNNTPVGFQIIAQDVTERRQMEQALRESEEKFSRAFRSSPQQITITRLKDGQTIEANDSFYRISGYSRQETIGRTSTELGIWLTPADRQKMLRILKENGQVYNEEFRFRSRSGVIRTHLFSAEPIIVNGEECLISIMTDISERQKIEQLQRDENHVLTLLGQGVELRELLESIVRLGEAHDPSIRGSLLLYDPARGLLFGAAAPSLPAEFLELLKDGLPVGPNVGSCGSAAYLRERVIVPDIKTSPQFASSPEAIERAARHRMLAVWSQPILGSSGELLGTIANYADKVGTPDDANLKVMEWSARIAAIAIERKRAEVALANEGIRRRILIEQSSDGIVVLDEEGQVYEANQRFAELLGYSMEEVRRLGVWDWEAQLPREKVADMIRSIDENGDRFESQHVRKDGSLYDVEISSNGAIVAGQKLIFCVCRDITERKRAEAALRESEEKFSKAFRSSPNTITITTLKEGVFLEVNDCFTRDTGWSRQEVIGHSSRSMKLWVKPEERDRIMRKLEESGRVVNEEYSCLTKSGEIRTMLFSAEPITLAGEPCIIAVTTDITERKQMEEKIRKSEERYRTIFESANDIIILMDRKGKIIDVNQKISNIGGYSRDRLLGQNFRALTKVMPKKSLAIVAKNFRLRTMGVDVPPYEVEMYRDDGELLNMEINGVSIKEGDKVIGTLSTLRDVTERRKSESVLRYQRELIDQIIATIPNAVLVIDKDCKVLLANDTFYTHFYLTKTGVENRPLGEVIRIKELEQALTSMIKTGKKSLSCEFRLEIQNVQHIFTAGILMMQNQRYLIFMNDVTEEREKQERLYLTDRLASVGEMASGVAHELNNPLTSIIGLSNLLVKEGASGEMREDLAAIYSEAQRCAAIIKNLLTFARKHAPKREPLQVTKILEDVLKLRAYEHRAQNIIVETSFPPEFPEVLADYFQMQQVFLNIILNAESAMVDANGRGTLKITGERVNGHVNIAFADDGPGIAKENLGVIFNPFFTTKEVGKGTGLGLSICYGIVTSHGGKIYAKDPVEKGATFIVELPVLDH